MYAFYGFPYSCTNSPSGFIVALCNKASFVFAVCPDVIYIIHRRGLPTELSVSLYEVMKGLACATKTHCVDPVTILKTTFAGKQLPAVVQMFACKETISSSGWSL
jgi:hypothetical protein